MRWLPDHQLLISLISMSHTPPNDLPGFDPLAVRQQFPLIAGSSQIYLDNGATTQKPESVITAVEHFYREYNANVHRGAHRLSTRATEAYELARERVRRFINARESREIIWTRGTTESINLVASCCTGRLKPGDEILLSVLEHHSNIVPWQMLAARTGAIVRVIPLNNRGELDLPAFEKLLNKRTRILALTHISNALGTVNPIEHCIRKAREAGALVLIDGAQALAHQTVDVQALGCDFYAFSAHKAFGPTGIGALYGRAEVLESLPPWQGGGEMIERVSFEGTTYNSLPWRFEAGTPDIAGAIGFSAAVEFLDGLNREAAAHHEQQLLAGARGMLESIPGIRIIGNPEHQAALLSFTLEGFHTYDLGTLLDQQNIAIRTGHHCTMPLMDHLGLPEGTARASFAVYNTMVEVEQLAAALEQLTSPELHPAIDISAPPAPPSAEPDSTSTASPAGDQQISLSVQLATIRDWQSRYSFIMKLGRQPSGIPESLKSPERQLHGCTSKVWLTHRREKDSGALHFALDSDARVIRGLGLVLLDAIDGMQPAEIAEFDMEQHFTRLGLIQHLSPSRSNGLRAIMEEIRRLASDYSGSKHR